MAVPEIKLNNPQGFDVPTGVFFDGTGINRETSELLLNVSLDNRWLYGGVIKRVWELHYDTIDYTGLDLKTLLMGTGLSVSPVDKFIWGGRIGLGISGGLTRSQSFFDSAFHPALGIWATAGIQFKSYFLEMQFRERKVFGQTLDDRTASPRLSVKAVSFGVIF